MSAALEHPPARMTVAEFLQWDSGDHSGAYWQLVDGEPVAMSPTSLVHGAIQGELGLLIGLHLRGTKCVVVIAPGIIPLIRASENFRIPDLGVTCSAKLEGHEMQEPVLLIEVLSPSNTRETRANVWSYTTLPSVREILVCHSTRIEAELLRRDGTDWPANPVIVGPDGTLRLDSIDFEIPLRDVYRTSGLS